MKKFVIFALLFILTQTVAFAEKADYRMMETKLPEVAFGIEEDSSEGTGFSVGADYAINAGFSGEDALYNKFYDYISPENLINQNTFLYGEYYYIRTGFIGFNWDDSLGRTNAEQARARAEQIAKVYNRFVSDNPEYFYVMPRSYMYYYQISGRNVYIDFAPLIGYQFPGFKGTKAELNELKAQYDTLIKKIDEIKDEIYFEGMSNLDKLLLAHDYIINDCAYYYVKNADGSDYYGDGYSYNAYGILINKKGVCQGLSFAYSCVLKALGMPIENIREIRSNELNHMWNFIKLGDNWYHVDLTWDDPLYSNADGVYDMNDNAYQHELHDYFLISDAKNTNRRNDAGYKNFTLEIVGHDEISPDMADDASFESGYFFNDPTNGGKNIQGRVEYEDGYYKKYNKNEDVYFLSDTLKAPDFLVSQITYNQYGVPMVWILGSEKRTASNENLIHYLGYYDKDGRLLKIKAENRELLYFGMYPVDAFEEPQEGTTLKIITLDLSFKPTANVPIIK